PPKRYASIGVRAPRRSSSGWSRTMLRSRLARAALAAALFPRTAAAQDIPDPKAGPEAVVRLSQGVEVARLLDRLKTSAPSGSIVIRNVKIVNPVSASVRGGQMVI